MATTKRWEFPDGMVERVRERGPLVHCITNYVTVESCANILLAAGASPIMADDSGEMEEITSICSALVLNLGTLNARTIPSMGIAGRKARSLERPIVLDPVGVGASTLRTETAIRLIEEVSPTVLRGNASEMKALMTGQGKTRGVDAEIADQISETNLFEMARHFQEFAEKTGSVVAVSGSVDLVADSGRVAVIYGGDPIMTRVTGCGCMETALTAAYVASGSDPWESTVSAFAVMAVCGEDAARSTRTAGGGPMAFRQRLIDGIDALDSETMRRKARVETII